MAHEKEKMQCAGVVSRAVPGGWVKDKCEKPAMQKFVWMAPNNNKAEGECPMSYILVPLCGECSNIHERELLLPDVFSEARV